MKYYVVYDTNVLVSSLITKNLEAPTVKVVDMIADGVLTPVFNQDILDEYTDVLHRPKFSLSDESIDNLIRMLQQFGQSIDPLDTDESFLRDADDKVFFEVVLAKREGLSESEDVYLVSGNLKHYPVKPFIVTPAELIAIIQHSE